MKNSLSKVQFCYFRLSCRIKNLYQMAKKAVRQVQVPCKKYIYVKHSLRKLEEGQKKGESPNNIPRPHPVLAVFRKLSP